MENEQIRRPPLFYFLTEIPRAFIEYVKVVFFMRKYKTRTTGDGHPFLIVPGFMGSDTSTAVLRKFLYRMGFSPHGWGLGRNYADLEEVDILEKKVDELHEKYQSKVTLIGWSLGGVYARQLAKLRPEKVNHLITLGSPYMGVTKPNRAELTYRMMKKGERIGEVVVDWLEKLPEPISIPSTAFYSKRDGIVSWKTCREENHDHKHQNIEVSSSHIGMGWNQEVLQKLDNVLFVLQKKSASTLAEIEG